MHCCRYFFILSFLFPAFVLGSLNLLNWRVYEEEVTDQEKEFIAFIVTTLGNKSLTKIYKEKDNLKKAGDIIDHIHPLKFLKTIFTDEELKAAIVNIRESRWVWGEFKKGLFQSLRDETKNKNMSLDYITDLAIAIDIDPFLITPLIAKQDWDGLISTMIKYVKREGDPKRYDM